MRETERRELAELVSLADFDVPPLATAPQQTEKRANLKHVNNMCLTQTAKSNSLLTLPLLFPCPLSINHLPLPSSFSITTNPPPSPAHSQLRLDSIHLNRWPCVNRLLLTGRSSQL